MGVMVQIRDLPEDVHRKLKVRAAKRGASLSSYLRVELERLASEPELDEVWAEWEKLEPFETSENAAEALHAARREMGWE